MKKVDMSRYSTALIEKIKPDTDAAGRKVDKDPFVPAQMALSRAHFAETVREQFFHDAYVDIIAGYFRAWLETPQHAQKEREYLYHCAMAMGSVKNELIKWSTYGKNVAAQQAVNQKEEQDESSESTD
jgi:hypothetical protein